MKTARRFLCLASQKVCELAADRKTGSQPTMRVDRV
jgi:hypothetical protein